MSMKTATRYLSIVEAAVYAVCFVAWAAMGFPYFWKIGTIGLCVIVGVFALKRIGFLRP